MRKLLAVALLLSLAACGGMQATPLPRPSIAEVQALQVQTATIQDIPTFYQNGLTLTQERCGAYFDAAVMASLQAAQTSGQVQLLSGLASAVAGLGSVPTPYTAGIGLGGGFLGAMLANQQQNSLAGPRPAGLATLTAAAQQALINATAAPRTGADAWAALYAVYRACSPSGIEALKEQAINAASSHLVVDGGTPPAQGVTLDAQRDGTIRGNFTAPLPGRALPMVRVR